MVEEKSVILVTGCSGRIGSYVMDKFKDSSYHLVGLDIVPPKQPPANFTYIQMDVSSDSSVNQAFQQIQQQFGTRIASVIHLAAYYNFTGGRWELYESITVQGTRRLLDNLQKFQVEQFIFSSTMLVHEPRNPPEKITENTPLSPSWEYPRSKIETEKMIREHHGSIPFVILRIAGCYDNECHSIPISNQIQRIYENQFASHVLPGDIHHGTTFLHLDDMADLVFFIVQRRHELPQELVLLVGEEETLTYDQIQNQVSQLIRGKNLKTYRIPKPFAKIGAWIQDHVMKDSFIKPWMIDFADDNYDLDLTKLHKTLGWKAKHTLSQTLPMIIKNLKANPLKWYEENKLTPPKNLI